MGGRRVAVFPGRQSGRNAASGDDSSDRRRTTQDEFDRFVAEATLGPPSTGTLVEVGCGEGQVSRRLAERNPDATVIGVDLSPASVSLNKGALEVM